MSASRQIELGDLILDREHWLGGRHTGIVVAVGLGELGERIRVLWDDGTQSDTVYDEIFLEVISDPY